MSISSIGAYQSMTYTSLNSTNTNSVSNQNSSQAVSGNSSSADTFEKSGAVGGGSTSSSCPKGNSTCLGCGSCQTSKGGGSNGAMDNTQSTNTTMLNALHAYDSQSKFL